jgi:multidrug efflux pump subunit AcrB
MLRAFNGECDAAIAKVNWGNISNMEARINKAFEAINKLGSTNEISITEEYLKLKLQELYLEFELEEQKYREKEEQRRIREQMREEEKALKEIEKIQKEAEADEERYQKALDKAKLEMEKAKEDEVEALQIKIKELQTNLEKAHEQKVRAISQAQLTKSGHVYIISNIGSFGEDVFKIGMTRRLEPLDRINELGDASVPFDFDVHGLIYSENAPELENKMHKKLESKRLNLVNYRAEFFKTSIDEIAGIVTELGLSIQLTKIAEAKEYRETASILKSKEKLIK